MYRKVGWLDKRLEEVRRIKSYSDGEYSYPASTAEAVARRLIKLDANENFFITQHFLLQIIKELEENLDPRLYPQGEKTELHGKIDRILHGHHPLPRSNPQPSRSYPQCPA